MTKTHSRRSLGALVTILTLLVTTLTMPAMAQTTEEQTDRSIFFGKVTQIDSDYVTIAIGTMDMPQMPSQGADNSQNSPRGENPPAGNDGQQRGGRNFLNNLTLTGELVTVQITEAVTLTKQGTRPEGQSEDATSGATVPQGSEQGQDGSQGYAPARPEGTPSADGDGQWSRGQGGFGMFGGGESATLADLTVDSIVMLTYQTSTQALLAVYIISLPEASSN